LRPTQVATSSTAATAATATAADATSAAAAAADAKLRSELARHAQLLLA